MYKAKCSRCGEVFQAKTRTNLLSKLRKHLWARHKAWMISRIKAGKKSKADSNPSVQDLVKALESGIKAGIPIIQLFDEKRYQQVKVVMDAVEPFLPTAISVAWRGIEAFRDAIKKR